MFNDADIQIHELKKEIKKLTEIILSSNKDFYTLKQAAIKLGISRSHLYKIRKRGDIDSINKNGKVYITDEAIKDYLNI